MAKKFYMGFWDYDVEYSNDYNHGHTEAYANRKDAIEALINTVGKLYPDRIVHNSYSTLMSLIDNNYWEEHSGLSIEIKEFEVKNSYTFEK